MNSNTRPKAPRYRRVPIRTWAEPWFLSLSAPKPSGRVLWLALATGPTTSAVPGLYLGGIGTLSDQLGWTAAATGRVLRELESAGVAIVDRDARLVFLPYALDANPPENPNVVKAWATALLDVQASPLREAVIGRVRTMLDAKGPEWVAAFDVGTGNGKPFAKPSGKPSGRVPESGAGAGAGAGAGDGGGEGTAGAAPRRASPSPSTDSIDDATYLLAAIRSHRPEFVAPKSLDGWARDLDLARRLDGRTTEQIRAAIDYAHRDPRGAFWRGNILSGAKLRAKFDTLAIQAAAPTAPKSGGNPRGMTSEQIMAVPLKDLLR